MVWAIADVINAGALCGEFGTHPLKQRIEFVFGEIASCDAGLVRKQEDEITGIIEPADGLGRVRHPADAIGCAHIAVVVIDDAVAIQKRCGFCLRGRHICALLLDASAITLWIISATSS